MALKTCGTCGGRFKRLDRHLSGRRGCAAAAEAARRARITVAAPESPSAGREPPPRPPPPPIPEDLGPAGRRLWEAVFDVFTFDPHELATLESACRELDRAHRAEQVLAQAGEYVTDRYGSPKQHPAVQVARSSRLASARLVQALGMPSKES